MLPPCCRGEPGTLLRHRQYFLKAGCFSCRQTNCIIAVKAQFKLLLVVVVAAAAEENNLMCRLRLSSAIIVRLSQVCMFCVCRSNGLIMVNLMGSQMR